MLHEYVAQTDVASVINYYVFSSHEKVILFHYYREANFLKIYM